MGIKTFTPKDRTRREHIGQLSRVVWCDPDAPAIILRLTDNSSIIGPATADQFEQHQLYRFHGRWKDGKFGPEFAFETFTRDRPLSRDAIAKYLTDTCRNIGKVTAEKLAAKFDGEVFELLRKDPTTIANSGLLSVTAATEAGQDLEKFARLEHTRVSLFGLFAGRGFPRGLIDRAIGKWGVNAPAVIEKDPFRMLVNRLPGCGFKRCDKMFLDLGKPADSRKRQACAAWNAMREDRTGSTWLDAAVVIDETIKAIPTADPVRALQVLKRAGWIRVRRGEGNRRYVAVRAAADAEQRIADNVKRLTRRPSSWPTQIAVSKVDGDGLPSEHQAAELLRATGGTVGCFVGGPGTGKTHTLACLLQQVMEHHGPNAIAVAAPTGKASVRAGESLRARGLDIHATTIHRLLEIGRNGHDGGDWGFIRNRENPLDVRFLVIDESSMIDVSLMADLLDAVPDGACVLFVGDEFQLPPVGHGAPLRDLLAAGVAKGELTEVRRNSGAIVRGCAAIKAGEPVPFVDRVDLDADDKQNLRHIDCDQAETLGLIDDVLDQLPSHGFDVAWEAQLITALNEKSDLSRTKLNERLGKRLNPDGKVIAGNRFRVGDKIICLRNTRLKVRVPGATKYRDPETALDAGSYCEPWCEPKEWYTANGEIGRVVAVNKDCTIARFGGKDVPLVMISNKAKRGDDTDGDGGSGGASASGGAGDFDLAWAITVHRSQGSEWPCVVTLIDDAASQIADRNFWYTAVSRARKLSIILGPRGVFERQVTRQALVKRRTFLVELIRGQ